MEQDALALIKALIAEHKEIIHKIKNEQLSHDELYDLFDFYKEVIISILNHKIDALEIALIDKSCREINL